jgi:Fe2+ or Zn2+ uptake regulation protein
LFKVNANNLQKAVIYVSVKHALYCSLKSKGLRLTLQRKAVIDCLVESGKPLSAEDIYLTSQSGGLGINLATVYRTLETLTEAGLVERVGIDLQRAYYTLCRGKQHLHHFFCLGCGESYDLPYCPIKEAPLDDLVPEAFTVTGHRYEVYGYCGRCSS